MMIVRSIKYLAPAIACICLSGCCSFNPLFDPHQAYEDYMNSTIGERPYGYDDANYFKKELGRSLEISRYKGQAVYQLIKPSLGSGRLCSTENLISVETEKIVGWRYIPGSDPQKCVRNKFHCGPW
jgi:hypothetical protein